MKTSKKYLVDTCIWIDYFRGRDEHKEFIETGIDENNIYSTGIIFAEILQGVKSKQEYEVLASLIDVIPVVECETSDWIEIGKIAGCLQKQGKTVPITDIAINYLAAKIGAEIISSDRHYDLLKAKGVNYELS